MNTCDVDLFNTNPSSLSLEKPFQDISEVNSIENDKQARRDHGSQKSVISPQETESFPLDVSSVWKLIASHQTACPSKVDGMVSMPGLIAAISEPVVDTTGTIRSKKKRKRYSKKSLDKSVANDELVTCVFTFHEKNADIENEDNFTDENLTELTTMSMHHLTTHKSSDDTIHTGDSSPHLFELDNDLNSLLCAKRVALS